MPRVMCKITSLLHGDQMILDGTKVLCRAWCHTTEDMKYHIVSHDVFVKNVMMPVEAIQMSLHLHDSAMCWKSGFCIFCAVMLTP